ncbi:futalosine hydrolase [Streptomyces boncukensis]|uniref:Futalosine hydrolase n=1 Tax=Streptomyces boncukensis TaxID=2711219 RepID=A0A6G4WXJ3_9ACTN|nr:futalosine hydrolase [Streptomyces boncukensis]
MHSVLVVTAVDAERDAVRGAVQGAVRSALPGAADGGPHVIAGGVGPAAAAASTATALARAGRPYDLVVSAGIGGGFRPDVPLVVAERIIAADLGAQTPDGFVPVTGLGFGTDVHVPRPELVRAVARTTGAVPGDVLTVSTVTGTAERAAELRARHPRAAAEAMEGFGVAEAAAAHGTPVLELRAVSNPVGPRDRAAWRIPEALTALGDAFRALVQTGVPPWAEDLSTAPSASPTPPARTTPSSSTPGPTDGSRTRPRSM